MIRTARHRICFWLTAIACLTPLNRTYADIEIVKGEKVGLGLFGTGQMLGLGEVVSDQVKKRGRVYLFLQQARLGFSGHLEDYKFYTELALGGENTMSSEAAFTTLEMRFDVPIWGSTSLRMGQFKTPYGAEFLTPDNERLFSELSISNLGSNWGRDIGLALFSKTSCVNWAGGVFTGGGVNTSVLPIHALPENFGSPLMMVRLGMDNTGEDVFTHKQAKVFKIEKTEKSLYLQGAYQIDTYIGHSSAMNIKAGEAGLVYQQNLLLNPAWNPYLTVKNKAKLYSFGITGLLRTLARDIIFTGEFSADISGFKDSLGSLTMHTARIQGSAAKKPWEVALRFATLVPDRNMGPVESPGLIGRAPFYEITPALSYYLKDWSKLVFEFQGLINVPVAHEPNDGSYVLADMPSQTTHDSGAATLPDTITRDFVPEFKLMWQITL